MESITISTIDKVMQIYNNTIDTLDKVLVGQNKVKKAITTSILCDTNSRILLTGDTGMGKTTLAKFLANNFNSERISITSDMIPSDIHEQLKQNPELQFLQIDEFNRASGKVQSAFIELFAEKQLSIAGKTYSFKDFYAIATENGADIAGIFNVPQAVYDRFDINISFAQLTDEEKRKILFGNFEPNLNGTISLSDISFTKSVIDSFKISEKDESLMMKMFKIIDSLMYNEKRLFSGSNIRAHKYAIKLAKLSALADGRDYIKPRDLADFVNYLYMHRINQNIAKVHSNEVQEILSNARVRILELKK